MSSSTRLIINTQMFMENSDFKMYFKILPILRERLQYRIHNMSQKRQLNKPKAPMHNLCCVRRIKRVKT